jgi:YidC/Oxa1 family membrane protein insertase
MASCTGGCLPMLVQMPVFFGLFMVFGRAIELRGMPFIGWISDLSRSDVIWHGFSIPYLMPDGIAILPIIMVFTTYFQTKQSMTAMTDPTQKKMMTFMMPAMMFVFSAVMPSGLVLYWIVSNLWGIAQYGIINRKTATVDGASITDDKKANIQDAKIVHTKKRKK